MIVLVTDTVIAMKMLFLCFLQELGGLSHDQLPYTLGNMRKRKRLKPLVLSSAPSPLLGNRLSELEEYDFQ